MTQPNELPVGPWETLLLKALTLVDEISTHGGVSEPFFTFGGGTVLMAIIFDLDKSGLPVPVKGEPVAYEHMQVQRLLPVAG